MAVPKSTDASSTAGHEPENACQSLAESQMMRMRPVRPLSMLLASAVGACLVVAACATTTEPLQPTPLYRNGFFYPWFGGATALELGTGLVVDPKASVTNNLNGDATVLAVMLSGISPCLSAGCALSLSSANTDMSAYYSSGHLQFDLRLGAGVQLTAIRLTGTSSGQFGIYGLNLADYGASAFTHVSVPIAALFPPTVIGTKVAIPFAIKVFGAVPGTSLVPVLYLDDIQWTRN